MINLKTVTYTELNVTLFTFKSRSFVRNFFCSCSTNNTFFFILLDDFYLFQ